MSDYKCEGLPNGPCPTLATNASFCQGDLWLCTSCELTRFPRPGGKLNENLVETSSANKTPTGTTICIDELLCFITNKMDTLPNDTIIQLCSTTFSEEEVESSKRKLFDLCADESTARFKKRQGHKKTTQNLQDM